MAFTLTILRSYSEGLLSYICCCFSIFLQVELCFLLYILIYYIMYKIYGKKKVSESESDPIWHNIMVATVFDDHPTLEQLWVHVYWPIYQSKQRGVDCQLGWCWANINLTLVVHLVVAERGCRRVVTGVRGGVVGCVTTGHKCHANVQQSCSMTQSISQRHR